MNLEPPTDAWPTLPPGTGEQMTSSEKSTIAAIASWT
jgi:hypothetical protein